MITAVLILAAAAVLGRDWLLERFRELTKSDAIPKVDARHAVAAALLVAAALSWGWRAGEADGKPTPADVPAGPLSLAGLFTGPTAAADAVAFAGLCGELADKVEWDGMQEKPRLTTGWQIADLRTAAREARMAGDSIGARQPLVRDAVHRYLDREDVLGKHGGPISPDQRSRWVKALREVRAAAEAAVR